VVQKALGQLNVEEKKIIKLRFFDGLSFAQMAKKTKINEGALRVKIHRTLKKLKLLVVR